VSDQEDWWLLTSPDAMTVVDPCLADALGYSAGDLEGTPVIDIVYGPDKAATEQMLSGLITAVDGFTNRLIAKSGEVLLVVWGVSRWSPGTPLTMMTCHPVGA